MNKIKLPDSFSTTKKSEEQKQVTREIKVGEF